MAANSSSKKTHNKEEVNAEEPKPVKLPLKPSEVLRESVEEAELLMSYASERGLELTEEEVKVITEAKHALENNAWNTEIEIKFWMVYRDLARRNYPVTVDSVRAARVTKVKHPNLWQKIFRIKSRNTLAYRTVRLYTVMTVITLLVMVVLHILFSIGTIRLNQIQKSDERLKEIDRQLEELDMMGGMEAQNESVEIRREKLMNELYQVNSEKENAIRLLEEWLRFVKKLTFASKGFEARLQEAQAQTTGLPAPPTIAEQVVDTRIGIIQEAQNYVMVLGWYILPLFYGLLGALAFVLRDLSITTKRMLFTQESNINHTLRLMLGTIAGLAVGVFWGEIKQQENFTFVRTLGPLLVAFLAGFTVEYVFALIEVWMRSVFERAIKDDKKVSG